MNYELLRHEMVKKQLIPRGIKDERVLNAMRRVPRHIFVPAAMKSNAYDDSALPIGKEQTISQPYMVAAMTELLHVKDDCKTLEIGTGSGYQTAVLAELSGEVFTIERISDLSANAALILREIGYENIRFMTGDGALGWPEHAPFDRIILTAAAPVIPETLKSQLKEGGIMVAPVGGRHSQNLIKITKAGNSFAEEIHFSCVFVPLIGKHGWQE